MPGARTFLLVLLTWTLVLAKVLKQQDKIIVNDPFYSKTVSILDGRWIQRESLELRRAQLRTREDLKAVIARREAADPYHMSGALGQEVPRETADNKPAAVDRWAWLAWSASTLVYSPVIYRLRWEKQTVAMPFCGGANVKFLTASSRRATDAQMIGLLGDFPKDPVTGKKHKALVIAFRGTQGKSDLMTDLKVVRRTPKLRNEDPADFSNPKKLLKMAKKCKECGSVHTGFLKQYYSLRFWVHHLIDMFVTAPDKAVDTIVLTGHSLGGGLSTIAMADLAKNGVLKMLKAKGITVVQTTIGSPRVGNKKFVEFFQKHVDVSNVRRFVLNTKGHKISGLKRLTVMKEQDPFSVMPQRIIGYRHVVPAVYLKVPATLELPKRTLGPPLGLHSDMFYGWALKKHGYFSTTTCGTGGNKDRAIYYPKCYTASRSMVWIPAMDGKCELVNKSPKKSLFSKNPKKPKCSARKHCQSEAGKTCKFPHRCQCLQNGECKCLRAVKTNVEASHMVCESTSTGDFAD